MPALRRSSTLVSVGRCTSGITAEQFAIPLLPGFALTSASSLSRSWGVRSQMPPVRSKLCVRDPSTLWPVCAASAVWVRIAWAPVASTIMAPGGSDRLSAAIAMPSRSASPDRTMYSNTSRLVPVPCT